MIDLSSSDDEQFEVKDDEIDEELEEETIVFPFELVVEEDQVKPNENSLPAIDVLSLIT
jgi:hypothetical protein